MKVSGVDLYGSFHNVPNTKPAGNVEAPDKVNVGFHMNTDDERPSPEDVNVIKARSQTGEPLQRGIDYDENGLKQAIIGRHVDIYV